MPTDQTVWVVHYSHKHGDDIAVYADGDKAHADLAATVRGYWDEITDEDGVPESPDGLTDEQVLGTYFDNRDDEFYDIDAYIVQ